MRLFVGVDLPGDVKNALSALMERLRAEAPDAKWVPRDNLHLTMSFLGEVDEARAPEIVDALTEAAAGEPGPIDTALEGAGAFPSPRRARVLWVGLRDPDGRLAALARTVAAGLEPLGFPTEKRPWTSHLTIARFRTPTDATSMGGAHVEPMAFTVPAITLFRSRLARPAPTYEPLAARPLGGAG
jgi:RNA 2',3'-cyclic 3'-phosphodiesterase